MMMTFLYCLLVIFVVSSSISAAILPVNQIKKVVHQAVRTAGGSIVDNFNTIGYNNVRIFSFNQFYANSLIHLSRIIR